MIYRQNWISKLERKYSRFAINNLMLIVVGAMAIVFIMDIFVINTYGRSLFSVLYFDRGLILNGQIWRIFTFLFLPPSSSMLFIIIMLFFYWHIGSTLENTWGSFGFTLFYLLGSVGAIISGIIAGAATNDYLNLSLFLAFALLYPDYEILLFFFIPIKMKWLALIDAIGIIFSFVSGSFPVKLSIIFALINLLIFFAPNFIFYVKNIYRRIEWKFKTRK